MSESGIEQNTLLVGADPTLSVFPSLFRPGRNQRAGRILCLLPGLVILCLVAPQQAAAQQVVIHRPGSDPLNSSTLAEDGDSELDADGARNGVVVWKGGGVVHVVRTITVAADTTLKIEPGAIVKFAARFLRSASGQVEAWAPTFDGGIDSEGGFNRLGGLVLISGATLTDIRDDSVGGDTNGDGGGSRPPGSGANVYALRFSGGNQDELTNNTIKYCTRMGRFGSIRITGNTFISFGGIASVEGLPLSTAPIVLDAVPSIIGNTFELWGGLNLRGMSPLVQGNTLRGGGGISLGLASQDNLNPAVIGPSRGTINVSGNTIEASTGGISLSTVVVNFNNGNSLRYPFKTVIRDNKLRGTGSSSGAGLALALEAQAEVSDNEVSNFRTPLFLSDAMAQDTGLVINRNRFSLEAIPNISLHPPVSSPERLWKQGRFVEATGNFWGDPTGPLDPSNADGRINVRGKGLPVSDGISYSPFIGGTAPPARDAIQITASLNPLPLKPLDTVTINVSAIYRLETAAAGKLFVFARDENGVILAQAETRAVSEGQTVGFPPLQFTVPELSNFITVDAQLDPDDNPEAVRSNIQSFRVERPRSSFAMNVVEAPAGGAPQLRHGFRTRLKVVFNYTLVTATAGLFDVIVKERALPGGQALRTVSTFTVAAPAGSNKTAESAEFEVDISLRDILRDARRDLYCEAVFRDGAGLIAGKDARSFFISDGPNSVRFDMVEPAEVIDDRLSGRPHLEIGKLPVYAFKVAYRVGTPNATGWRVRVGDDQALDEKGNLLSQYTAERDVVENASTTDTEQTVRSPVIGRTPLPAGTRTLRVIAKLIAPGNTVVATTRYDLPVREAPQQAAQKAVPAGASQITFAPLPARLNFTANQKAGTATVEEFAGHVGATLSAAAPAETDEASLTTAAAEAVAAAPVRKLIPLKKYWAVYNDLDEGTFTATLSFTYILADFPPLPGFNEDALVLAGLNPLSGELEALPTTLDRTARTATTPYLKFFEVCTLAFNVNARTTVSVSAASYRGFDFAAESINAAFGENLATATQAATSLPLPTELAGTRVLVRDSAGTERLAPLFFVSAGQVNYQIPPGTAAGAATVIVSSGDGALSTGAALITAVAPGLFAANADGQGPPAGYAIRVKADGAQVNEAITRFDTAQNRFVLTPLDLGPTGEQVFLVLFGTGFRAVSSLSAVSVRIGGVEAQVLYAGTQGGFVGLDQMNLLVPRTLIGRGEVELVMTINDRAANTLKLNLK